jgi:hypothetical protein
MADVARPGRGKADLRWSRRNPSLDLAAVMPTLHVYFGARGTQMRQNQSLEAL